MKAFWEIEFWAIAILFCNPNFQENSNIDSRIDNWSSSAPKVSKDALWTRLRYHSVCIKIVVFVINRTSKIRSFFLCIYFEQIVLTQSVAYRLADSSFSFYHFSWKSVIEIERSFVKGFKFNKGRKSYQDTQKVKNREGDFFLIHFWWALPQSSTSKTKSNAFYREPKRFQKRKNVEGKCTVENLRSEWSK